MSKLNIVENKQNADLLEIKRIQILSGVLLLARKEDKDEKISHEGKQKDTESRREKLDN